MTLAYVPAPARKITNPKKTRASLVFRVHGLRMWKTPPRPRQLANYPHYLKDLRRQVPWRWPVDNFSDVSGNLCRQGGGCAATGCSRATIAKVAKRTHSGA